MRLLVDENFPRPVVIALRELGFEVTCVAEDAPGGLDEEVLARCDDTRMTLLTLDKDFGELVFRRGLPAGGGVILFRIEAESLEQFTEIALAALRSRTDWSGFFTVVRESIIHSRIVVDRREFSNISIDQTNVGGVTSVSRCRPSAPSMESRFECFSTITHRRIFMLGWVNSKLRSTSVRWR